MHRTTIELDDKMLHLLKDLSRKERKPLRHMVRELLRIALDVRRRLGARKRVLQGWHVSRVALPPGINPADRTTYASAIQRLLP